MNKPRAFILALSFLVLSTAMAAPPTLLLPVTNARIPVAGVLSGGQPTQDQIATAGSAGYKTVINLRPDTEPGFEWEVAANAPVLLHCGSGNRIGAMLGL